MIIATSVVWVMERISTLTFIIGTVGLTIALYRSRHRHQFIWSLTDLVISMVQVVANVVSMVMTSSTVKGGGQANLDVVTPGGAFVRVAQP